jgi:histone H4
MAPPSGAFARRGGKVHSSQRQVSPPLSGRGRGKSGGLGLGKGIAIRRKIKVPKDNIFGITKGDIRRLARRGGVKRISAGVYDAARTSLKEYLTDVISPPPPRNTAVMGF